MFAKLGLLGDDPGHAHPPPSIADSIDDGTVFINPENAERILSLKRAEFDRIEQRVDELVSKLDSMKLLP